jgi:hypothetical protein
MFTHTVLLLGPFYQENPHNDFFFNIPVTPSGA